jgi:hypothetical protein
MNKSKFPSRYELKIDDSLVEVVNDRKFVQEIVRWKKLGRISMVSPDWKPKEKSAQPETFKKLVRAMKALLQLVGHSVHWNINIIIMHAD